MAWNKPKKHGKNAIRFSSTGPYRYKTVRGVLHKICTGPLHKEGGEWMPMRSFYILKKGKRAGKPVSQCSACIRASHGYKADGGLVPVDRVWFVFAELEARIGRAETCRRLGLSTNLWYRLDKRTYSSMYRTTARAAMVLLHELRDNNIVRHKDSIRYGATARGKKEKEPTRRRDFNGRDEHENELRRLHRKRAM